MPASSAAQKSDTFTADDLHALVLQSLDDDQAQEVTSIPLAGKSSIGDYMVIASGRSTRHVAAVAEKLAARIKQELQQPVQPLKACLLPIGCCSMPAMLSFICSDPEVRSFYNLERMWGFGDEGDAERAAELEDAEGES